MSQAMPGMHYCAQHQGNHSHYAQHNCKVCCLEKERDELVSALTEIAEVLSTHPDAHIGNKIVHFAHQKAISAIAKFRK